MGWRLSQGWGREAWLVALVQNIPSLCSVTLTCCSGLASDLPSVDRLRRPGPGHLPRPLSPSVCHEQITRDGSPLGQTRPVSLPGRDHVGVSLRSTQGVLPFPMALSSARLSSSGCSEGIVFPCPYSYSQLFVRFFFVLVL